ncbi:dinitrogenase reductase [Ornithobacterium rhinotracheale]|nr:dinitrogenase reductase [Ornithobacterium rhinotracheale]
MFGAVAGDVLGSIYEWHNVKEVNIDLLNDRCFFTDDTVLTVAIAQALLTENDFGKSIRKYGKMYRHSGFGGRFKRWLDADERAPYGSFGNGSAMRVSPVAYVAKTMDEVLDLAKQTAEVTHNHPEGIKGAQAVAAAVFMAIHQKSKQEIKEFITEQLDYDLDFTLDEIRPTYHFDVTCQGSVPQGIVSFLESHDFESAIQLAISIGGDSDTIAAIAGAIAAPFYGGVPSKYHTFVERKLPIGFKEVIENFYFKFIRKIENEK